MSNVRWSLALFAGFVAACGSPGTALAPSGKPLGEAAGLTVRPIFTIAALLLEPTELRGLVAQPYDVVRSESGEQRIRQVLTSADGGETLRIESALDGSLRFIAKSGVTLEGGDMTTSVAVARALRHLMRLGLEIPPGGPTVSQVAARTIVVWTRQVRGVPVPGDGTRVVLNGAGALVGLAIEESPLAAPPARIARADVVLRAATLLLPYGATVEDAPDLAWVLPTEGAGEPVGQRVPRRLAWCVSGALRDGGAFELQLDAGSLVLLGWDGAP